MTSNPRTRPIFDGSVAPEGIDLIPTPLHPSEMFWRQLKFADFDVSEMSYSSLTMAQSKGDERWIGLPVFTTRHFFQTWTLIRRDAGIESPADMTGKRAGEVANRQRIEHIECHLAAGLLSPESGEALRTPLLRHGVKANRTTLETVARYSHEQGLTPRQMALEEVFARSTLDQ